jgi:hypothetical protein
VKALKRVRTDRCNPARDGRSSTHVHLDELLGDAFDRSHVVLVDVPAIVAEELLLLVGEGRLAQVGVTG